MFKDRLEILIKETNNTKYIANNLSNEFGITIREVHTRIKSIYQKDLKDLVTPSYEKFTDALILSQNIQEFKDRLNIKKGLGRLYEKYFNVSTFASAKLKAHNMRQVVQIRPTREDNFSLLISQRLGDGCFYFKNRSSLRIQHGIKQYDYLKLKVQILSTMFPTLPGVGTIKKRVHTQGHEYCSWEGTLRNSFVDKIREYKKSDLVKYLTPLGIYLLYMDDGCLSQTKEGRSRNLSFSNGDREVLNQLCILFKTYGFNFRLCWEDKKIVITETAQIVGFIDTFIKPFKHITPDSMMYKTSLMI